MANQNGIFIVLKAWLPVTGSISEQIAKLQMVEKAHASGDYAELLGAAKVEEIKTEQKTRRIEDEPVTTAETADNSMSLGNGANREATIASATSIINTSDEAEDASGLKREFDNVPPAGDIDAGPTDDAVPQFLKSKRKAPIAEAAE
ncbi:hypothetical protein GOA90_25140 [Sinorhizobium meliloti]|nr:hypothetical protein [Sinorhizobium meliloti]